jgi:hypothetical protein
MYKALCVAVAVAGLLVLAGRSSSADPAPFTSPVIVAKGKLNNQKTSIPTTTIFTPSHDGLFRLSVYGTISRADPSSGSYVSYSASWTDDSGQLQSLFSNILIGYDNTPGMFSYYDGTMPNVGGLTVSFEAKANSAITYSTYHLGSPDNSEYSLYYTLERLE